MKNFKEFVDEDKDPCWKDYKMLGMKKKNGKKVPNCIPEEVWDEPSPKKSGKSMTPAQKAEAKARAKAAGRPYPNLVDNMAAMKEDWQDSKNKNPEGGLTKSGVMAYRREHPGSHLQTAVTTPPSKLKPGSKAANRRKSFCARMGGMKDKLTSSKTANDPKSRINLALKKWNC